MSITQHRLASAMPALVAVALTLTAAVLPLGAASWEPIGPWGGPVYDLAADHPSATVLAATGAGIWRTPASHPAWTLLPGALPDTGRLVTVASCGGQIWTANTDLVLRFTGSDWASETSGVATETATGNVQLHCGEGRTVYLHREGTLLRHSGQPGTAWQTVRARGVRGVAVDPVAGYRLAAVVGTDLLWSDSAGTRWQRRSRGRLAADETLPRPMAMAAGGGALYVGSAALQRSLDGGRTFTTTPTTGGARILATRPDRPRAVYAADLDGFLVSQDRGRTWRRSALPAGITLSTLVPAGKALWLGRPGLPKYDPPLDTVFRSADDGRSWTLSTAGLAALDLHSVAVASLAPVRVYATAQWLGTLRLEDATWTSTGSWANPPLSLSADPFVAGALLGRTGLYSTLAHSADGGTSWSLRDDPALCGPFDLIFDPLTSGRVWAANLCGVSRSDEHGESFTHVTTFENADGVLGGLRLSAVDAQRLWAVSVITAPVDGAYLVRVATTGNAGATWSASFVDGVRADVAPDPFDVEGAWLAVWDGETTRILHSDDLGASWTEVATIDGAAVPRLVADLDVAGSLYVLAGAEPSERTVLRSRDAGVTWEPAGQGLPTTAAVRNLYVDPGTGRLVAWGVGIWVLPPTEP